MRKQNVPSGRKIERRRSLSRPRRSPLRPRSGHSALGRGSLTPQYNDPNTGNAVTYDTDPVTGWTANNGQAALAARHRGGSNVGYSDGHVKFILYSLLWTSKTNNHFRYDSTGN